MRSHQQSTSYAFHTQSLNMQWCVVDLGRSQADFVYEYLYGKFSFNNIVRPQARLGILKLASAPLQLL